MFFMNKCHRGLILIFVALAFLVSGPSSYAIEATSAGTRPGLLQRVFDKNGRVAIGSGTVKSKSGSVLIVTDKDGADHTVNTDSKTHFRRRFWGGGSFDEIQVGDTVNVIGRWADDSHVAVKAVSIRDLSIQKRFGVFFGNVTSLTSNGWVMTTIQKGDQTVTVTSSTKFINRKGDVISQSDVKVGDKVRVRGLWDKTNSTITEIKEVKDFSVPVI